MLTWFTSSTLSRDRVTRTSVPTFDPWPSAMVVTADASHDTQNLLNSLHDSRTTNLWLKPTHDWLVSLRSQLDD